MAKNNIATQIGLLIRELRIEKGLSQEDLSFQCGLHRTYIGSIERGEKVPSIATIQKITEALHIPLSELFERYEKTQRKK